MSDPTLKQLMCLGGKVAVVTGAGSGIGRATALRLAEAGAHVVSNDRLAERAEETAALIEAAGGKASVHIADVCIKAQTDALIGDAVRDFGGVDILINNAGIMPPVLAIDMQEDQWDLVLSTNLRGMFFASQAAAKAMIAAGKGGSIVNISSMDATMPSGALAHYDASKAGVVGLTHGLAKEWGPHQIRVNAVAPGNIKTPGGAECGAVMRPMLGIPMDRPSRAVLGRPGEPDDMARVVLFLASPLAGYVTGSTLLADGGALRG